ncbi:MAG: DNA-methyltransferase, partial [Anaerolineales bacterium]
MPHLNWHSKKAQFPAAAELFKDSIVYPTGSSSSKSLGEDSLILGENLAVMQALLPRYENKIDLIYADPPFFTNRHYPTRLGREEDSRRPEQWQLGDGYTDAWRDLDEYLDMLYPRLILMHRLLSPRGTLYLHLDWHADAYARVLLDEIFGADNLLNEIIWVYHGPSPIRRAFNRKHDTILAYTKTENYIFNVDDVRLPYAENTVQTFNSSKKAGFGKIPDLARGKVPEDWWYFPVVARLHSERSGYPTQKPLALLERIVRVSSTPESTVADFFCGSGTTGYVAAKLSRNYLLSDITWRAVHTTRLRLIQVAQRPFSIYYQNGFSQLTPTSVDLAAKDEVRVFGLGGKFQIHLPMQLTEGLDYWEVDPDFEGNIFHARLHAARS